MRATGPRPAPSPRTVSRWRDPAFTGGYAATSQNNWYTEGGRGRTQVTINERFADDGDPRTEVEAAPTATACAGNGITYYRQAMYTESDASLPFMTWQENALIRAEAALIGDVNQGVALGFVNMVRDDAGLDDLEALDQAALINERDKTLFTTGARLIDQRRFGLPFTYVVPHRTRRRPCLATGGSYQ